MRSILKNRVDEFLKILEHDKGEWFSFWKRYKRRLGKLLDEYEKLHGLSDDSVKDILESLERRVLDRFRRFWEERKRILKEKTAYELRMRSKELDLSKADFVVFLIGALSISDWTIVDGEREKVILVDVLKLWRDSRIDDLPNVVLDAVEDFRSENVLGEDSKNE